MAGFQTVDVHRFFPQQAVTVLLGNPVPRQAFFAVHVIEVWLAVNNRTGEHRQIVGRAMLTRGIQAVNGFEMGIAQIQFLHVVVHHLHELRLAARHIICQRHAGIVAGVHNQAAAQIAYAQAIARLEKHQ